MSEANERPSSLSLNAPVAQPDRVPGFEPEGREFESPRARICFRTNWGLLFSQRFDWEKASSPRGLHYRAASTDYHYGL